MCLILVLKITVLRRGRSPSRIMLFRSLEAVKKKVVNGGFAKKTFLENYLPSAKKSKLPSHQVFGVFALEVNKILQATPTKLRREMGMCATTIHVQQQQ